MRVHATHCPHAPPAAASRTLRSAATERNVNLQLSHQNMASTYSLHNSTLRACPTCSSLSHAAFFTAATFLSVIVLMDSKQPPGTDPASPSPSPIATSAGKPPHTAASLAMPSRRFLSASGRVSRGCRSTLLTTTRRGLLEKRGWRKGEGVQGREEWKEE